MLALALFKSRTKASLSPTIHQFKLGQTVEYLKSFIEGEYGIPISLQKLFLSSDTRQMMNPLSLLDFKDCKGVEEVSIRVEGPLGYRK